jgi:hypothetical protein
MPLPALLPVLPDITIQRATMHEAYRVLTQNYRHGLNVLQLDAPDPLQISLQIDKISSDALSILEGMEEEQMVNATPLLPDWVDQCAMIFGDMVAELRNAKELAAGK